MEKPFVVHANSLIESENGHFLLVKEGKQATRGLWNLPGGHLEHGEKIAEGARREAFEETALRIELLGLALISNSARTRHAVGFVFWAKAEKGAEPSPQPGEILETRWFEPSAILALPDRELVNAPKIKAALGRVLEGRIAPIDLIAELEPWDLSKHMGA